MLLLGLLLVAATAAFTGLLIADNMSGLPEYSVTVLGNTVADLNTLEAFCAGLALALLFGLGLMMTARGIRRAGRRASRARADRRAAKQSQAERNSLAAQLEWERQGGGASPQTGAARLRGRGHPS